jgi:hypothetical protein
MAALRDTSELMWPAVAETLATLELGSEHAAAARLAKRYAQVIDEARDQGWAMRWIGPLLLDSLTALGATPQAKAALAKGVRTGNAPEDPLEALRRSRRRGA